MKIWVALAGWVGAVLRFVPVEFDVLRFWNSVRFAPALQAPAIFTLCLCGFWARVAGWRSWAVYSTLDPSTTGCIQNVLDWVSRLSDWVWGWRFWGWSSKLWHWASMFWGSGSGFRGRVSWFWAWGSRFWDGFRRFGVGLRCWGLFEAFGVGFPKFTAKP